MRQLSILALLILSFSSYAQTIKVDSLHTYVSHYADVAELLKGQVSGVRVSAVNGSPDEGMRVDIRGVNTLRANTSPLWIVDGVVLSNALSQMGQPFFQSGDAGYVGMAPVLSGVDVNDIESMEVLKGASATALYGSKGANGVIVVRTKKPVDEKISVDVNSNVGLSVSEVVANGITPSVLHNHNITVGSKGKNSHFRVSAFFRESDGVYKGTGRQNYGARASFGANKADAISFGGVLSLNLQQTKSPASVAWYGAPSLTLASRKIAPMSYNDPSKMNSVEGWLNDYDNHADRLRTTDNLYLNIKLAPGFIWKNNAGVDFQQNTRNVWYGNGTVFGKAENGAAAVLNSSLLNLDISSALEFSRYINSINNISASLVFELLSQQNKYNSMAGTDFFSHELRSKALSLMQSKAVIRHFMTDFFNPSAGLALHYDYNSLVGVDISARYDTWLQYDKDMKFMDNFYPSAHVYADLKGLLLSDSSVISALRIEGGYGVSGARQLMPYIALGMYSNGGYPAVEDALQAYYRGLNRVLSHDYDTTVRTAFLNNLISLSATYYDRRIEDGMDVYYYGEQDQMVSSHSSRIGNRGAELTASAFALKNGNTELEICLNAAYNFNRVLKADPADEKGMYLNSYDMYATVNREGYPVSSIFGYTLDADNVVNGEGILGSTIPAFTGAIDVRFRMGDLRITAMADYAAGHHILNMNRMLASGQEYVSEAFVEKGDYLRLARVCASYDFSFRKNWIRSLRISLAADNLLTATSYSGWNPDVNSFGYTNMAYGLDYGSCPMLRNIVLGVAVKF